MKRVIEFIHGNEKIFISILLVSLIVALLMSKKDKINTIAVVHQAVTPVNPVKQVPAAIVESAQAATADDAIVMAMKYVRANLVAPSTADFPSMGQKVYNPNKNVFTVYSYVDAQNSFGAKVRSQWMVKLRYVNGDMYNTDNWELLKIKID